MDQTNCCHEWKVLRSASPNTNSGHGGEMHPGVFECKKCSFHATIGEATQLSVLSLSNDSLRLSRISLILSLLALMGTVVAFMQPVFEYRLELRKEAFDQCVNWITADDSTALVPAQNDVAKETAIICSNSASNLFPIFGN